MGYDKFTGIISKETNAGDADRYLTILTMERGKVECYAKGIRNQKSKLASSSGLFCYGEYQLFKKSNRYILTSANLIKNFYNIRNDIIRLTYAVHFLELSGDIILDGQPFPEAVKMLLNSLFMLGYTEKNPELISRVFEMRILSMSGFSPILDKCTACGKEIPNGEHSLRMQFSNSGFGVVCGSNECKKSDKRAHTLSMGALHALRHIVESDAKNVFNFSVSENVQRELSEIIPAYLRHNMDKDYTKLKYLNNLR